MSEDQKTKAKKYWIGKGTLGDIKNGDEIPEGFLPPERMRFFEKAGMIGEKITAIKETAAQEKYNDLIACKNQLELDVENLKSENEKLLKKVEKLKKSEDSLKAELEELKKSEDSKEGKSKK